MRKTRSSIFGVLFQDWTANARSRHVAALLVLFRLAQVARERNWAASWIFAALYRGIGLFAFSIDVPTRTSIGPGFTVHHGFGLVINASAVIGANVSVRHGVTIGSRRSAVDAPRIGDSVEFGPTATVLGPVCIGSGATIGAGCVVVSDVPDGAVVVASPVRILAS